MSSRSRVRGGGGGGSASSRRRKGRENPDIQFGHIGTRKRPRRGGRRGVDDDSGTSQLDTTQLSSGNDGEGDEGALDAGGGAIAHGVLVSPVLYAAGGALSALGADTKGPSRGGKDEAILRFLPADPLLRKAAFGRGLGDSRKRAESVTPPSWLPVPSHQFYHRLDYEEHEVVVDDDCGDQEQEQHPGKDGQGSKSEGPTSAVENIESTEEKVAAVDGGDGGGPSTSEQPAPVASTSTSASTLPPTPSSVYGVKKSEADSEKDPTKPAEHEMMEEERRPDEPLTTQTTSERASPDGHPRTRRRIRLRPGAAPVSRLCTCMAASSLDPGASPSSRVHRYVAVGDTAGYVTLCTLIPTVMPAGRLETTASRREYEAIRAAEELRLSGKGVEKRRKTPKTVGGRFVKKGKGEDENESDRSASTGVSCGGPSPSGESSHAGAKTIADLLDEQLEADNVISSSSTKKRRPAAPLKKSSSIISVTAAAHGKAPSADRLNGPAAPHANAIEALCFVPQRCENATAALSLCVATKVEVECIDCITNAIIWRIELGTLGAPVREGIALVRGAPVRLDCHPNGSLLAGFFFLHGGGGSGSVSSSALDGKKVTGETTAATKETEEEETSLLSSPLLLFHPRPSQARVEVKTTVMSDADVSGVVPLVELEGTEGDAEGILKRMLLGPRAVALWDRSDEHRVLAIVLNLDPTTSGSEPCLSSSATSTATPQELLCLDAEQHRVLYRAILPTKVSGSKVITTEALSQSEGGRYTVAASARGIRLFETRDLSLLAIYGEGLALHGHSIVWQDCLFMPRNDGVDGDVDIADREGRFLERQDEMCHRSRDTSGTGAEAMERLDDLLIVGVPHAHREPLELNETLHFFDARAAAWRLPGFTVTAPARSGGIVSLIYADAGSAADPTEARLVVTSQSGDCQQMAPTFLTDWPGKMYPPGYLVIDDNLEYIEDEDELDVVVGTVDNEGSEAHEATAGHNLRGLGTEAVALDADLALALKRSIESAAKEEDAAVDVLNFADEGPSLNKSVRDRDPLAGPTRGFIPCRPEPFLQQVMFAETDVRPDSTTCSQTTESQHFGSLFPQAEEIQPLIEKNFSTSLLVKIEVGSVNDGMGTPSQSKPVRGKRVKSGSLEAMLQNSIDSTLRQAMLGRELWADGCGTSLLRAPLPTPASDAAGGTKDYSEKSPAEVKRLRTCEACRGRMVFHKCGLRVKPKDLDAIVRAEKEKAEKEAEEKRQKRLAKKRITDAKRREAKRKKKREEEERRKREEEERTRKEAAEEEEMKRRAAAKEEERKAEEQRLQKIKEAEKEKSRMEFWKKYEEIQARRKREEEDALTALQLQNLRSVPVVVSSVSPLGIPTTTPAPAPDPTASLENTREASMHTHPSLSAATDFSPATSILATSAAATSISATSAVNTVPREVPPVAESNFGNYASNKNVSMLATVSVGAASVSIPAVQPARPALDPPTVSSLKSQEAAKTAVPATAKFPLNTTTLAVSEAIPASQEARPVSASTAKPDSVTTYGPSKSTSTLLQGVKPVVDPSVPSSFMHKTSSSTLTSAPQTDGETLTVGAQAIAATPPQAPPNTPTEPGICVSTHPPSTKIMLKQAQHESRIARSSPFQLRSTGPLSRDSQSRSTPTAHASEGCQRPAPAPAPTNVDVAASRDSRKNQAFPHDRRLDDRDIAWASVEMDHAVSAEPGFNGTPVVGPPHAQIISSDPIMTSKRPGIEGERAQGAAQAMSHAHSLSPETLTHLQSAATPTLPPTSTTTNNVVSETPENVPDTRCDGPSAAVHGGSNQSR